LGTIVIARPKPSEETPQHLCLDAGYVGEKTKEVIDQHQYIAHIRPAGEDKAQARSPDPTKKPRALWSSNGSILGSTVHAEYWYAGRSSPKPMKPFCIWPVPFSVFSNAIVPKLFSKQTWLTSV
jgi:hypothetical protein